MAFSAVLIASLKCLHSRVDANLQHSFCAGPNTAVIEEDPPQICSISKPHSLHFTVVLGIFRILNYGRPLPADL